MSGYFGDLFIFKSEVLKWGFEGVCIWRAYWPVGSSIGQLANWLLFFFFFVSNCCRSCLFGYSLSLEKKIAPISFLGVIILAISILRPFWGKETGILIIKYKEFNFITLFCGPPNFHLPLGQVPQIWSFSESI